MSPNSASARFGQVRLLLLIAPRLGADKTNLPLIDFIGYISFVASTSTTSFNAEF